MCGFLILPVIWTVAERQLKRNTCTTITLCLFPCIDCSNTWLTVVTHLGIMQTPYWMSSSWEGICLFTVTVNICTPCHLQAIHLLLPSCVKDTTFHTRMSVTYSSGLTITSFVRLNPVRNDSLFFIKYVCWNNWYFTVLVEGVREGDITCFKVAATPDFGVARFFEYYRVDENYW